MTAALEGMLTLIALITAGAVLITGAAFAVVNDLSPAELAREVARFFRHGFRSRARLPHA
jgi:hypothetical protein